MLLSGQTNETVELLKDYIAVSGLTNRQFAALAGAGYSLGQSTDCDGFFCQRNTFLTSTTTSPSTHLSNVFFNDLLNNQWAEHHVGDRLMYKVGSHLGISYISFIAILFSLQAVEKDLLMYKVDTFFLSDPELLALSQEFASDNSAFLDEFIKAWRILVNADMFDGPSGNLCFS